jgi:hypothetical protein
MERAWRKDKACSIRPHRRPAVMSWDSTGPHHHRSFPVDKTRHAPGPASPQPKPCNLRPAHVHRPGPQNGHVPPPYQPPRPRTRVATAKTLQSAPCPRPPPGPAKCPRPTTIPNVPAAGKDPVSPFLVSHAQQPGCGPDHQDCRGIAFSYPTSDMFTISWRPPLHLPISSMPCCIVLSATRLTLLLVMPSLALLIPYHVPCCVFSAMLLCVLVLPY